MLSTTDVNIKSSMDEQVYVILVAQSIIFVRSNILAKQNNFLTKIQFHFLLVKSMFKSPNTRISASSETSLNCFSMNSKKLSCVVGLQQAPTVIGRVIGSRRSIHTDSSSSHDRSVLGL